MKKKILTFLLCGVIVLEITGYGKQEIKNLNNGTNMNNSSNESNNNQPANKDNTSSYDYVVYCNMNPRTGQMALYGNGSYSEYYIKNSSVIKIKQYIATPTTITDTEFNEAIEHLKEEYGEDEAIYTIEGKNITIVLGEKI